jgi:predicted transcriptional regulator
MFTSAKQRVQQLLEQLPEDCSIEDVQYHLYVVEKISNRLKAAESGEFIPHNEVEQRLAKWLVP